ncbi:ROK family transcriptional regulator [Saccharopolyspora sp. MS10]|uniref:ROK family transcriptional regulator n=1 Tax=Saccharopolyspora sp. MS10 TaxID=3385973 RepID=UPI00399F03ED
MIGAEEERVRGGDLDRVRRGNLAEVLGLVHRAGALSRAEITRATGLSRSTVGGLIAQLAGLGLVTESEPGPGPRVGRPSPVVRPDPGCAALAVNPELDAVTVGLVHLGGEIGPRVRHEVGHPVTAAEAVEIVVGALEPLAGDRRVLGVGIAVPGLVREADGVVRWAPHLGWREEPIAAEVRRATGVPASAANDASLGALAEHLFGAGAGLRDLVYLNGGASGIGGGIIANGAPLGGIGGYAGEFGRNRAAVADPDDRAVPGGALEDEVSRARLLALLGAESADPGELTALLERSADPAVRAELARQARVLAVAVAGVINVLDPEAVVLGGFLADVLRADPAGFRDRVRAEAVAASAEGVRIVPAALGPDLLLAGAGQLALRHVLTDPTAAA